MAIILDKKKAFNEPCRGVKFLSGEKILFVDGAYGILNEEQIKQYCKKELKGKDINVKDIINIQKEAEKQLNKYLGDFI